MKNKITIGNMVFSSKSAATEYFREILRRNITGGELFGEDRQSVEALLWCHPSAATKAGDGINGLLVLSDERGGHCFFVRRNNGTLEDFSMHRCINGQPPPFSRFSTACRTAVVHWVNDWRQLQLQSSARREQGLVLCAVTGEWLPLSATDADHIPPLTFAKIVCDFIAQQNIDVDSFSAYQHKGTESLSFADPLIAQQFSSFHESVANLRLVKRIENQRTAYFGRLARQQECA